MSRYPVRHYSGFVVLAAFISVIALSLISPATIRSQETEAAAVFPIAEGFTDVIPRQLVRANNDHLYVFAPRGQYSNDVVAYWTGAPGLPDATADFTGTTSFTEASEPISLDAVYDGASTIHVLMNLNNGLLKDYPFDVTTNTFKAPHTLATGMPTISGDYIGTSGVSGMVDLDGNLHVANWGSGWQIIHQAYTYTAESNSLVPVGPAVRVDEAGTASHPSLAVSPVDNSVTIAWASEAIEPRRILARTRSSSGVWSAIERVSTAKIWVGRGAGVNIDQGPSLVIDSAGLKHLTYIEDYDTTGQYGKVHYSTSSGSGWTDSATPMYSHDPAMAINSAGEVYIIGHGPQSDLTNNNLYAYKKQGSSWAAPQLIVAATANTSFDASVSVRWSAVGWNRPEEIEFVFFRVTGHTYNNTTVFYARLGSDGTPDPTPTPSVSAPPPTPLPTLSPTPVNDLIFKDDFEGGNLNLWPGSFTDGDIAVNNSGAMVGTLRASFNLDDNTTIYLMNDSPTGETRYRARFYFDPNSISMANNTAHFLMYGANANGGVVRVEFGRINNSYAVRAGVINDGGQWANTGWTTINDSSHFVEFDWTASTGVGHSNGTLYFWVDGVAAGNILGVDNDTRRVESAVIGAVTEIDSSTRGLYLIDAFESRRLTYIGPDPGANPPPPPPASPTFTSTPWIPTPTPPPPTAIPTLTPRPPTLPPPPTPTQPPANQPPVAVNDSFTTPRNTRLTITVASLLANDSDPNGDSLTITGFTMPAHGTIQPSGANTAAYTPATHYTGTDSFTYTISDGRGGTATGTVTITVGP